MVVLFLTVMIAMILLRALRKDIANYNDASFLEGKYVRAAAHYYYHSTYSFALCHLFNLPGQGTSSVFFHFLFLFSFHFHNHSFLST